MHHCANIVLSQDGSAAAALVRSGEVVDGIATARRRRGVVPDRDLARGPARLAQALGLTLADNGAEVLSGPAREGAVTLEYAEDPPERIESGPRVGVRGPGGDGVLFPWRFWLAADRFVSAYRPASVRRPAGENGRGAGRSDASC